MHALSYLPSMHSITSLGYPYLGPYLRLEDLYLVSTFVSCFNEVNCSLNIVLCTSYDRFVMSVYKKQYDTVNDSPTWCEKLPCHMKIKSPGCVHGCIFIYILIYIYISVYTAFSVRKSSYFKYRFCV